MKSTFKPLSLAVAVATAAVGYAGTVNGQAVLAGDEQLGDLALVPYYTVKAGWSTGVSVINTSSTLTQVVKIRMRRAVDSMDALDFNVIMSPNDVWTGYLQQEAFDGEEFNEIRFYTNDASCVAPNFSNDNYFIMPDIYRVGAEEGYIEIMGMGSAIASQPIAVAALHNAAGVPADCARVRDNFYRGTTPTDYYPTEAAFSASASTRTRGVINSTLTAQYTSATNTASVFNTYQAPGNDLKVSWFIKDDNSGTEIGGNSTHIADFMQGPSITNQSVGINEGDLQGFDHPDLNGGAPTSLIAPTVTAGAGQRGKYLEIRNILGGTTVINDWSANISDLFTVDTDWVITTPGQYLMTNLSGYINSLEPNQPPCLPGNPAVAHDIDPLSPTYGANCDFRDIPLTVLANVYDREERGRQSTDDELVVSPTPPIIPPFVGFPYEVNVVQWGSEPVLDATENVLIPVPANAEAGWASVAVTSTTTKTQAICDFTTYGTLPATPLTEVCTALTVPQIAQVPLIGFVAWQRNFEDQPSANYGRAVGHSFLTP